MTSDACVRALTPDEMASSAFWRLLQHAVEVGPDALRRIHQTELPKLEVIGSSDGAVFGFIAFRAEPGRIVIEYIAVDESRRGEGLGRRLIVATHERHPILSMHAETDDDAVGFYRALGFTVEARSGDPRWPDRRRYDCILDEPAAQRSFRP